MFIRRQAEVSRRLASAGLSGSDDPSRLRAASHYDVAEWKRRLVAALWPLPPGAGIRTTHQTKLLRYSQPIDNLPMSNDPAVREEIHGVREEVPLKTV